MSIILSYRAGCIDGVTKHCWRQHHKTCFSMQGPSTATASQYTSAHLYQRNSARQTCSPSASPDRGGIRQTEIASSLQHRNDSKLPRALSLVIRQSVWWACIPSFGTQKIVSFLLRGECDDLWHTHAYRGSVAKIAVIYSCGEVGWGKISPRGWSTRPRRERVRFDKEAGPGWAISESLRCLWMFGESS